VLLRQERLAEALLAGFDDLDPSFHSWLTAASDAPRQSGARVEAGYRDGRHPGGGGGAWPRRCCCGSDDEAACRVLMQCAAEDGELGAACGLTMSSTSWLGTEYDRSLLGDAGAGGNDQARQVRHCGTGGAAGGFRALSLVAPRRTSEAPPPSWPPGNRRCLLTICDQWGAVGTRVSGQWLSVETDACLTRFREWYFRKSWRQNGRSRRGADLIRTS